MGLLKNLFGGGESKNDLIRRLVKHRVANDPMAADAGFNESTVDSLSNMQIGALPDAGIVTNVETYLMLKRRGLPEGEIFDRIETHRSRLANGDMPSNCDLHSYIEYRVDLENVGGAPISADYINYAIEQSLQHFAS